MRKLLACAILSAALMTGAAAVSAAPSPTGTPTRDDEVPSPKTSDFNIFFIGGLGVLLAGTAAVAGYRMKKYE